jgi:hypothetical protein
MATRRPAVVNHDQPPDAPQGTNVAAVTNAWAKSKDGGVERDANDLTLPEIGMSMLLSRANCSHPRVSTGVRLVGVECKRELPMSVGEVFH